MTDSINKKDCVSIVIPAYNEEKRIRKSITELRYYLKSRKLRHEIIVVDDGSTDRTIEVLKEMSFPELRVISITKSGKGKAVREGVLSAVYDYVFFMDADLSTGVEEIGNFIGIFKKEPETDIIIGSRYIPEGSEITQPPFRSLVGKTFSLVKSALLGINYYDSQCGFKAFRKDAAMKIFPKSVIKGFSFDVEILYIAQLNNLKIKEVSVDWRHQPGGHVNILSDSIPMLIELFQIFANKINYLPKAT